MFSCLEREFKHAFYTFLIIFTIICAVVSIYAYKTVTEMIDYRVKIQNELEDTKRDNLKLLNEIDKLKEALKQSQGSTPGMKQSHLKDIISSVLVYLDEKHVKDWTRLLCLTVATESDMGRLSKQVKGPARGITQVEPATEKETLKWLAKHHPKLHEKVHKLRIPAKLKIHEAECNVAYSIALAYSVYRMRKVNPKGQSTESLAKLYKKHYNTYKGKATVKGVLAKLIAYNVKL